MKNLLLLTAFLFCLLFEIDTKAQIPDPDQGLRADWLRGTWGINWKPVDLYNGGHEGLSIEPFLDQISHLKTIDYLQIHLGESSIKSPVHMGPHPLLESFWEGDTDSNGDPINLIVPRASFGEDPFLEIVKATRAAGLKVMVYVNSSNMLSRGGVNGTNPDYIPNITERWKAWCDTNTEAQAFIASQPYHTGIWDAASGTYIDSTATYPERKYMFCYAEFVLKVYAIRYGDLIDGWCFDSGSWMGMNGDNATNGVAEDQMIYRAFAEACRAGNPYVACSFQNSPERQTEELNPFSEATHADDFMFGHPYNGGNDGGSHTIGTPPLYDRNYAHIEKIIETNGNVHSGIDAQTWTWDDKVVGHYDPPMSTSSWNGGNTAALTDDEFNLWNLEAVQYGGAISWGIPLVAKSGTNEQLVGTDWALAQLNGMDAHLMKLESPGSPNWARAVTAFPAARPGQAYTHVLVEGVDFWDPEDIGITGLSVAEGNLPEWLTITETEGVWTFSGTPPAETQLTDYMFTLRVEDPDGGTNREVTLPLVDHPDGFTNPGDGSPVWKSEMMVLPGAFATVSYLHYLLAEVDFYDFEGDDLTITITEGAEWLTINAVTQAEWQLGGTPSVADIGANNFKLTISDGTRSTDAVFQITVSPDLNNGNASEMIKASANTNYGVDEVAVMTSEVLTAFDGKATFQLSIDVKPDEGKAITSGSSGGDATSKSWGLGGDGRAANKENMFFGDAMDWAHLNNIQVVSFEANGGDLTLEDFDNLTIESLMIVNAQSGGKDAVALTVNGETSQLGNLGAKTSFVGVNKVESLSIGSGDSNNQTANKWSVEGITVSINFNHLFPPVIDPVSNIEVDNDPGICGAVVEFVVTATDPYNEDVTIVTTPESGSLFESGVTTVYVTATDESGYSSNTSFTVTVNDTDAPVITMANEAIELWPVNNKQHTFTVADFIDSVNDNCDDLTIDDVIILSVSCDEMVNGNENKNANADIEIAADCKSVDLRSTRNGNGNGRFYTIVFQLTDSNNLATTLTSQVVVPHDKGKNSVPVDDGILYTLNSDCSEDSQNKSAYKFSETSNLTENVLVHRLYPNPTSDKIIIEISSSQTATYSIFNQVGQRIMIDNISGGSAKVDMSGLKSGIYLVRVQGENETFTGKVIKE